MIPNSSCLTHTRSGILIISCRQRISSAAAVQFTSDIISIPNKSTLTVTDSIALLIVGRRTIYKRYCRTVQGSTRIPLPYTCSALAQSWASWSGILCVLHSRTVLLANSFLINPGITLFTGTDSIIQLPSRMSGTFGRAS